MKYLAVIGTFVISLILAPLAVAQQDTYRPPLGDIMGKIQLRHIKLWFAGKLANWELAPMSSMRSGQAWKRRQTSIAASRSSLCSIPPIRS